MHRRHAPQKTISTFWTVAEKVTFYYHDTQGLMCELLEIMQDTPATSVGLMLVSRLRRRPNIKPTLF